MQFTHELYYDKKLIIVQIVGFLYTAKEFFELYEIIILYVI